LKLVYMGDERASRERAHILMRTINLARQFCEVVTLSSATTEVELLDYLKRNEVHLVLVPWYRYLGWSKVEAFYGLTRTSGPTFAGYYSDQILPYELGDQADHYRVILLDLAGLQP